MQGIVLKGGRVLDPSQGINQIADVVVADGKIVHIGNDLPHGQYEIFDVSGCVVSPGFIDIHVHAYGILGFAYPDRIGVYQGVTSFVEAGGPGVATFEEFIALMKGRTVTDLYAGAYIRPIGIVGVDFVEGDIRTIGDVPIEAWLDIREKYQDIFRYLKIGAFGNYGPGIIKIGKGLAEILQVPLYIHTGDLMETPAQTTTSIAYRMAEAGDIITHIYHNNPGSILDSNGKVLPEVKDAARRGVIFDIGFGSFNFSFEVAEKALNQDILPHTISSDLQQINVTGPTYSLTNVMSIFLALGFSLSEVVERVTLNPARALSLEDQAGSLRIGNPADITVFKRKESSSLEIVREMSVRGTKELSRFSHSREVGPIGLIWSQLRMNEIGICEFQKSLFPLEHKSSIPSKGRFSLD